MCDCGNKKPKGKATGKPTKTFAKGKPPKAPRPKGKTNGKGR